MKEKKNQFSGQIGFVLAAAGSAVGVGNLWRFPYLAAKDGGGLFLIVYLALVLTFGFALLSSDIAIGRKTQKSAIGAYEEMQPRWKFLGILTFLVPVLIMTYYAVIGDWITKYAVVYFTGQANAAAQTRIIASRRFLRPRSVLSHESASSTVSTAPTSAAYAHRSAENTPAPALCTVTPTISSGFSLAR